MLSHNLGRAQTVAMIQAQNSADKTEAEGVDLRKTTGEMGVSPLNSLWTLITLICSHSAK